MLGLIIKDSYSVLKQAKIFLVLTIVFAVIPSKFLFGYSVFYASILPITAMAYDERAKWDKLAAMLPYSTGQLVGSKYLFGYLSVGIVMVCTVCSRCAYAFLQMDYSGRFAEDLISFGMIAGLACIVQAINLPIMIRIGVEKGRMVFVLFTVLAITIVMGVIQDVEWSSVRISPTPVLAVIAVIAVGENIISYFISKCFYRRKR